jgi:exodeoxyribonuclease (lambda-induced)
MAGASPDGLVGDAGLLELKCPSATTHIAYLLGDLEGEYWPQCQGQLYITDREWVDLVAFSPVLPSVVVRIVRDEEYIDKLRATVDTFIQHMLLAREELKRRGCVPAVGVKLPATVGADPSPF